MYFEKLKAKSLLVKLKSISAGTFLSIFTLAVPTTAATFEFDKKLINPDVTAGYLFQHSIAIDENYALVGYSGDDANGENSGAAYLYDITTGELLHKLTSPDASSYDYFGSSIAIDDNHVLIGSSGLDDSVYLFNVITGDLLHKFTPPDSAYNFSGLSVAIDDNYALIPSRGNGPFGITSGPAYLFDVTTGELLQNFIQPDSSPGDFFESVAIDKGYALIGSHGDDDNGHNSGAAYLYDVATGDLLQKLIAPDGASGDHFGRSVAIDDNYALIGSRVDDFIGSAYLFDVTTGDLIHKFTPPDGNSYDHFGTSVSVDDGYVLIGSDGDDDYSSSSGAAYLYDIATGNLLQKLIAPDASRNQQFGIDVAIDNGKILIASTDGNSQSYLFTANIQQNPASESVPEPSSLFGILGTFVVGALCRKRPKNSKISVGKN
ncbi:MAG: PEP-CTERM sorting domain-containing protein [Crocosphaera sp.]|nr:PEP-CTERM sorting domain-containing protein [Crocosphaera sp.]